jgi:peptide/nickel transport system substrate-binding protein
MERKVAWWNKLGMPQYGGEIVIRLTRNIEYFDPYFGEQGIYSAWLERLHANDWTLDPTVFDYKIVGPNQYVKGHLAESWEFTDPSTYVVHLRRGIHFQDIPPVNGREFTSDDVAYHYNRLYGLGGFTKIAPYHAAGNEFKDLISVTATDKYTVVFKFKTPNPVFIADTLEANHGPASGIEAREAVEKWGDVNDWHHAIGTGPFILQDFIPGSSATLIRNPNYWGHDERYPENKLPYVNKLKFLIIPDQAAALAAMRAGKIDVIDQISLQNAQSMQKTNPEILQITIPLLVTTIDPRNDRPPFNDIRVRKALQLAIDQPTIAKSYYNGTVEPYPSTLTSSYMKGWGFPYEEWPQDLKDQYAYNPTLAKQLLADAGYPNGFKTNIVADTAGDMDLLQIVKSYFTQVGIDMEIRPMVSAAWTDFVLKGHKHDQLAQKGTVGSLAHTYESIRQLCRFQTGHSSTNYLLVNDPVFDAFYPNAMAATSVDEVKQVIRDANKYVARQHFAISLLQPKQYSLYQPWVKGYNGQFGGICGPATSPHFLFFYPARFWVDQDIKKSFGHLGKTRSSQ